MYYIKIFIFNILSVKNLFIGLFNIMLCNLNHLLINLLLLALFYSLLSQLKSYFFFFLIILYAHYINTKQFSILSNFYFGYYKIHPMILYCGLMALIYKVLSIKHRLKSLYLGITSLLVFALILGSLWALYQNEWGAYWSNDSIEIILVIFVVVVIFAMHIIFKNYVYSAYFLVQSVFLLLCLRYNLLYTKHNFFKKVLNISGYQYLFYSLFIVSFTIQFVKHYSVGVINLINILFYFIIIQLFYNYINIKEFAYFNSLVYEFYLNYAIVYICIFLKKKLVLHVSIFIFLFVFNLLGLNYQKHNSIYVNFTRLQVYSYFYYTKALNLLVFVKNINSVCFYYVNNILVESKILSINQSRELTKISIINYF